MVVALFLCLPWELSVYSLHFSVLPCRGLSGINPLSDNIQKGGTNGHFCPGFFLPFLLLFLFGCAREEVGDEEISTVCSGTWCYWKSFEILSASGNQRRRRERGWGEAVFTVLRRCASSSPPPHPSSLPPQPPPSGRWEWHRNWAWIGERWWCFKRANHSILLPKGSPQWQRTWFNQTLAQGLLQKLWTRGWRKPQGDGETFSS